MEQWDKDEIKAYLLCDKNGNPTRHSIKLDDIYFDEELKFGQPRELEQEHYNKYYLEMLQGTAPRVPYSEGLLWQKSGMPAVDDRKCIQHIFSAAKEYIVLGGQHFVKALKLLREHRLSVDKTPENQLPPSLRIVEAEVLTEGTPFDLRSLQAGRHQHRQSSAEPTKLQHFFRLCVQRAQVQKEHNSSSKQPRRCEFDDQEVYHLLERSGLRSADLEITSDETVTKQEAAQLLKEKVCPHS